MDQVSSYRPIYLQDTMGKVLEDMVLQRLNSHLERGGGLSENQFGFRKGRSTVDAIKAVVDLTEKA
ncbi:reverse transcriptase domain-containing protein, partial [Streptococcus pyogenes]